MSLQAKFETYKSILENALKALRNREFFAQYPEMPSPAVYGEDAQARGQQAFENQLNKPFDRLLQSGEWITSAEKSPYKNEPIGIQYPIYQDVNQYVELSKKAFQTWKKLSIEERTGVLIECLERIKNHFYEIAFATMHTTGQGFMMSFQASGPHANDRALEAIAMGYEALTYFANHTIWTKPMGKITLNLEKEFIPVPKGVALAIGCSTFPIWNTVPGMFASLITGNTVIVKPHPLAIYPIAIVVAEMQRTFQVNGLDPNIVQIAVDQPNQLITKLLAEHKDIKIIDFTGSSSFGNYIESLPNKITFTEKAGVNSIILDSTTNYKEMLNNIAFSVSLYSGQMCTAPQNIMVSKEGIQTENGIKSFEEFAQDFKAAVEGLCQNPKAGPAVCGAIQNENTLKRIEEAKKLGKIILEPQKIQNPEYPNAMTSSPLILAISQEDKQVYEQELFGPVVLLIQTNSTNDSIAVAKEIAQTHGSISCLVYSTKNEVIKKVKEEMMEAATSVSFNLYGPVYVNQNAAFSDFHVTGGNPAGNASFTDASFVTKRFHYVGFRQPK